ncbi:unnamed protein product [Parnassius apollo]|uniref:(apollo) hypothetical protein n=1 Tax=Parnassius apollo TaxID=110799 RepID=A0A8S3X852_PARAO|nr:unnamed protein product [Parnassius apollo]
MTDVTKKVQEYKDSIKQKAEHLIIKGFPEKIVKLNEMLETSNFQNRDLADVHQDLNIPIPPPAISLNEPNAKLPCNKPLSDLIHLVKPHIRELVEDSNLLKMWISFMIPKIEDGNNFGVSIQEDTLAEIQSVESEAAAFFDQISRYFISRAKIVSKVAKYPHIDDYRRAVRELDEKEYLSLWLVMCEIRNRYCSLHDIVIKNLEKIKKPRSSNADSLY